ncbi:MAG: CAP domain-containing protein [Thermodesulfobacteriota bacterium]|nr:CAP domain-containing protein [Thermodesulfobacteriota bacterium]
MKSKAIHIILVFALIFGLCITVSAEANDLSEHELAFLELINEARENPLVVASSMGLSPDRILEDFPDLKDALTEGLPPLTLNKNLYKAACTHTADMLENSDYSHDSLDGRTYEDRITATGYLPKASGESLGLLGFSNFIDPDEAVRAMFEKMFRDELDPSSIEQRNILDPGLKHVGIALGTGTLNFGGYIFNVYMVTCDFGSSVERAGIQLFQLINQARSRPLDVAASLGMDPDQILTDLPELHDILTEGLPPLSFNLQLYRAAGGHVKDMLENGYYSHDSLDGRTYEDRIRESGYDPLYTGESMGLQCLGADLVDETHDDIDRLISLMFKMIFTRELNPDAEERNILDPSLREVGISVITGSSTGLGGICGDNLLLMVADFGLSSNEEQTPGIVGVIYSDLDQDMLYSPGEGIDQVAVSVDGLSGPVCMQRTGRDDTSSLFKLYSNEAGGFGLTVGPGEYRISVVIEDHEMTEYIEVGEENRAVWFSVPLPAKEPDP